jgi:hypothetical protein
VYGILSHWRKALSNEHMRREGFGNDEEHASQNDDLCPEGCGCGAAEYMSDELDPIEGNARVD